MHLPTGQGLGLHRLRGHLGWVLLTSDLGSFATADLRGGQQPSSELTMHWELAWREHQAWDGDRTFLKEAEGTQTIFPCQPQSTAQPWGLGKLWQTAQTKQSKAVLSLLSFPCCPFSTVLSLQTKPAQKLKDSHQTPPFPHPKAVLYFCMASRQLKIFGISLHHFQISISLVAVMNPPRNWNLKMNNQGGFFPTIIFFFPLEK